MSAPGYLFMTQSAGEGDGSLLSDYYAYGDVGDVLILSFFVRPSLVTSTTLDLTFTVPDGWAIPYDTVLTDSGGVEIIARTCMKVLTQADLDAADTVTVAVADLSIIRFSYGTLEGAVDVDLGAVLQTSGPSPLTNSTPLSADERAVLIATSTGAAGCALTTTTGSGTGPWDVTQHRGDGTAPGLFIWQRVGPETSETVTITETFGAAGSFDAQWYVFSSVLPICATVHTFDGTQTGGWGPAWDVASYSEAVNAWVADGSGRYQDPAGDVGTFIARYKILPPSDSRYSYDMEWAEIVTDDFQGYALIARAADDGSGYIDPSNGYAAVVSPSPAGDPTLRGLHIATGDLVTFLATVPIPTLDLATRYTLHLEPIGIAPTILTGYLTTTDGEILAQVGPYEDSDPDRQHEGSVFVMSAFQGSAEGIEARFDNLRFCGVVPLLRRWFSQII